jgi:O-antigen/teichoic acid export membrane protein
MNRNNIFISGNSLRKHFLKSGVFASSSNLIFMLANFAIQIIIARLLGPESLGVYFLLFSIVAVCVTLVRAGIDRAILRLIAEANGVGDWAEIKGLVRTGILMVTVSGLFITVLLWIFAEPIGNKWFASSLLVKAINVGAVIVIFRGLQSVISESFRGLHAIGKATFFQGAMSSSIFLIMLFIAWLLKVDLDLEVAIFLNVVSLVLTVLIAGITLMRILHRLPIKANLINKKSLISIALPMLVTSGSVFILSQADILILGSFLSKEEVGFYGAASRLAGMVATILLVINAILPPVIAELYSKMETERLERIVRGTASIGFIICFPVSIVFILWGDYILTLLYGSEFVNGTKVLVYLTIGKFFHVFTGSSGLLLNMSGHHKTMMNITVFVTLISIAGFFIVTRTYGKEGVAIIAATALIVQNLFQVLFAKKLVGIWTFPSINLLVRNMVNKA